MQPSNYGQQQRPFLGNEEYCSSGFTAPNSNYHYQLHQQQEQMCLQHIEPHPASIQHHQLQGNFIPSLLNAQVELGNPSPSVVFPMRLDIDQHGSKGSISDQLRNSQQYPPIFAPLPYSSCNPQSNFITNAKQPFWKHLNTTDKEKSNGDGGLEAIYGLVTEAENNNQTCSGSALTGENSPKLPNLSPPFAASPAKVVGTTGVVDHGSENSIGEETIVRKSQQRVKKRKRKENLTSIAELFENLVKKVIDNQERLHKSFLEVVDKMDKKRTEREEEWRRQESDKYNREAVCRQHKQALASNREAIIISSIEKITGQTLNLPPRNTSFLELSRPPTKEIAAESRINCNNRWPKAEVDALIQVRTSIETKFQQPGPKAPLWDEVSSLMGSMGYERSAKRCKEKWENINKYYKKTRESSKKRSSLSKTCAYFNQLDQIYPRTNSGKEEQVSQEQDEDDELKNYGDDDQGGSSSGDI